MSWFKGLALLWVHNDVIFDDTFPLSLGPDVDKSKFVVAVLKFVITRDV